MPTILRQETFRKSVMLPLRLLETSCNSRRGPNMEYGNYSDHIQIGHSGDAIRLIEELIDPKYFSYSPCPEYKVQAYDVLKAIKDAIEMGVI
jgi:hypothetical protein